MFRLRTALAPLAFFGVAACDQASTARDLVAPAPPAYGKGGAGVTMTNLGGLGGVSSAMAIDTAGKVIVGYSYTGPASTNPMHATRWTFAGGRWNIEDLASSFPPGVTLSNAQDVNGRGDIAGLMYSGTTPPHAFLLSKGAPVAIDLHTTMCNGATDTRTSSSANAINSGGEVV